MKSSFALSALLSIAMISGSSMGVDRPSECDSNRRPGQWSKLAIDISPNIPSADSVFRVCSPDGKRVLHVEQESWWLEIGGGRVASGLKRSRLAPYAEITWAPDGNAFSLVESEGYSTGFSIKVYRFKNEKWEALSRINRIVTQDFERRHRCHYMYGGEDVGNRPNISGLGWKDNDHIIIVAEVPPIGICENMNYFGGYVVTLSTLKIAGRYKPQQVKDLWGKVMGQRLESDFERLSADLRTSTP